MNASAKIGMDFPAGQVGFPGVEHDTHLGPYEGRPRHLKTNPNLRINLDPDGRPEWMGPIEKWHDNILYEKKAKAAALKKAMRATAPDCLSRSPSHASLVLVVSHASLVLVVCHASLLFVVSLEKSTLSGRR